MTTTKLSEGEIADLEIDVGTTIKDIVVVAIGQKGQMYAMIEEAMNMTQLAIDLNSSMQQSQKIQRTPFGIIVLECTTINEVLEEDSVSDSDRE